MYDPRLNFKPFDVAIAEDSHVAGGISSGNIDVTVGISISLTEP